MGGGGGGGGLGEDRGGGGEKGWGGPWLQITVGGLAANLGVLNVELPGSSMRNFSYYNLSEKRSVAARQRPRASLAGVV